MSEERVRIVEVEGLIAPCKHVVEKPAPGWDRPFGIKCTACGRRWRFIPDAGGRSWKAHEEEDTTT